MKPPVPATERAAVRREMRAARRALPAETRRAAALALCDIVCAAPFFTASETVALYVPCDGEIDVLPVMHRALRHGKRVYLPVVPRGPHATMRFARFTASTPLADNRFGIPEPAGQHEYIEARRLDLVLAPLVAFDDRGHRIGMGAGYYDHCFRFLRNRRTRLKPRLVGVAYELQRRAAIESREWDIPMWCVATEQGVHRPGHAAS